MEHKVNDKEPNKKHYVGALCWWLTVSIIAVLVVVAGVLSLITKFKFGHSNSSQFLHVPNLSCNLLSIRKLTHDLNCLAIFYSSNCKLQELSSRMMIGSGKEVDGLFL